jgi:hypothetical protein
VNVPAAAETVRAELDLGRRLLPGDEKHAAILAERAQRHEQERRLPDPRVAAHEDEARRDEATTEDAVELRHARGNALGVGGLDLDEAKERTADCLGSGLRRRDDAFFYERAPATASGTLPEPFPGRVPALGAGMLDRGGLCHLPILRAGPDGPRACDNSGADEGAGRHTRRAPRPRREAG